MTTYNTGNPIGSTDARDRLDNTENMDILENSTSLRYHADRLGTVRKTRYGMQKEHDTQIAAHEVEHDAQISAHEVEHDAQMAEHENDFNSQLSTQNAKFNTHISGMAISNVGTFSAGYTLTNIRQSLTYSVDGYEYSWTGAFPKVVPAGATPATSGGIGINAWVVASIGASIATPDQTRSRLSSNQVVSPAGLNAVVPYAPTVNPTLDLDFSKQKYRWYAEAAGLTESSTPSLMTFTRSTIATYFDAMGVMKQAAVNQPRIDYDPLTGECKGLLVEEQRTNLLTLSDTFLAAGTWALGGGCLMYPSDKTSPTGKLRGVKLQSTGVEFTRLGRDGVPATAGTSYSLTFILGRGTATHAHFTVEKYGISVMRAYVDLTALTCVVTKGSFTAASATAKSIGAFIAVTIVFTPSTNDALAIFVGPSNGSTGSVAGTTLYVYSAQLEVGAFPTSYIPTPATFTGRASTATYLDADGVVQTAASGVARSNAYDYDSDGVLRPIGLLLEGAATNLFLQSINFASGWSKNGTFVTSTSTEPSPTGEFNAVTCTFPAEAPNVSGFHSSITLTAGQTVTASVFVKPTNSDVFRFGFDGGVFGTNGYALFTFSTGSVDTNVGDGAPIIPTMKKLSGGWYRVSITRTAVADGTTSVVLYNGVGGASVLTLYGAQAEVGSYATSYIPTTTAQVTRAADTSTSAQATRVADDAKVDGENFSNFYNQTHGTLVARGYTADSTAAGNSGTSRTLSQLSGGTDGVRVGMSNLCGYSVVSAGVEVAGSSSLGTWSSAQHALGVRIKKDDFAATRDGGAVSTDTSAATPRALKLQLGSNAAMGGWLNGHVSRISYYPQPFTNEELQAMTA